MMLRFTLKLVHSFLYLIFYLMVQIFLERPKRVTVKEDAEKKDEEEWILKDVIFVEDVKSLPVGMLFCFFSLILLFLQSS